MRQSNVLGMHLNLEDCLRGLGGSCKKMHPDSFFDSDIFQTHPGLKSHLHLPVEVGVHRLVCASTLYLYRGSLLAAVAPMGQAVLTFLEYIISKKL